MTMRYANINAEHRTKAMDASGQRLVTIPTPSETEENKEFSHLSELFEKQQVNSRAPSSSPA